jgi:D-xylose transport system substrate-binding protein
VLDPHFSDGSYTKVAEPGGTWDNQKALTLFEQQFTAHPEINAVVAANDGLGGAVISALKTKGIAAKTVPVTGQDATLAGLQNVLAGYQCGTVYKPIYAEAQAAAALAIHARAGQTPPASLVTGQTMDSTANADVASVLLTPTWVTPDNIESTVVADQFVKAPDLCTADLQAACDAARVK